MRRRGQQRPRGLGCMDEVLTAGAGAYTSKKDNIVWLTFIFKKVILFEKIFISSIDDFDHPLMLPLIYV